MATAAPTYSAAAARAHHGAPHAPSAWPAPAPHDAVASRRSAAAADDDDDEDGDEDDEELEEDEDEEEDGKDDA